jgi:large subunit ribosomal protein L31e
MANKDTKDEKVGREYIIPLREKSRSVPRYKKTPKAIKTIKEFIARHMKVENRDLNKVKIDKSLNEFMWARGIRKHPHKIKVKATIEGENIKVELVDYPNKLKFKKLREEKRGKEALESIDKKKTMMQKVKEGMQNKGTNEDKDKDGLDDKKEAVEKEKTSAEATQEIEKAQAKMMKHQTEKPKKSGKPMRVALQK